MKTDYQIANHAYSWCHGGWDGEYMALSDTLKDELVEMYYQSYPDFLEEAFPALVYELGVEQVLSEIYKPETESRFHEIIRNVLYKESEDALREICDTYYERLLSEDDHWIFGG